jgi:hypothetical protein
MNVQAASYMLLEYSVLDYEVVLVLLVDVKMEIVHKDTLLFTNSLGTLCIPHLSFQSYREINVNKSSIVPMTERIKGLFYNT